MSEQRQQANATITAQHLRTIRCFTVASPASLSRGATEYKIALSRILEAESD